MLIRLNSHTLRPHHVLRESCKEVDSDTHCKQYKLISLSEYYNNYTEEMLSNPLFVLRIKATRVLGGGNRRSMLR